MNKKRNSIEAVMAIRSGAHVQCPIAPTACDVPVPIVRPRYAPPRARTRPCIESWGLDNFSRGTLGHTQLCRAMALRLRQYYPLFSLNGQLPRKDGVMRIPVTAPTGNIGRRIVPELLAPEFSVRVIEREPNRLAKGSSRAGRGHSRLDG
jgi:hypothetical protein